MPNETIAIETPETWEQCRALILRAEQSTDPAELRVLLFVDDGRWNNPVRIAAVCNPSVTAEALREARKKFGRSGWFECAIMKSPVAKAETLSRIGNDWAPLPRGSFLIGLNCERSVEIRGETARTIEARLVPGYAGQSRPC